LPINNGISHFQIPGENGSIGASPSIEDYYYFSPQTNPGPASKRKSWSKFEALSYGRARESRGISNRYQLNNPKQEIRPWQAFDMVPLAPPNFRGTPTIILDGAHWTRQF
jgi:hypothetical protein